MVVMGGLKKDQGGVTQDAWGNILSVTDTVPGGMPFRYVGAFGCRYDADTGLIYMRQRWYSSDIGRFISRDPVRGSNRYRYCLNNPVKFIDPSGRNTQAQNANIAAALGFIQSHWPGTGISTGLLTKLQALNNAGLISVEDLGDLAGGWNGKKLVLNIKKLLFLNTSPPFGPCDNRKYMQNLLQLAGFLVHEGEHAFNPQSDFWTDEQYAFRIEQLWYYGLYQQYQGNAWAQGQLQMLAADAQYDAATSSTYTTIWGNHPFANNPAVQSLLPAPARAR